MSYAARFPTDNKAGSAPEEPDMDLIRTEYEARQQRALHADNMDVIRRETLRADDKVMLDATVQDIATRWRARDAIFDLFRPMSVCPPAPDIRTPYLIHRAAFLSRDPDQRIGGRLEEELRGTLEELVRTRESLVEERETVIRVSDERDAAVDALSEATGKLNAARDQISELKADVEKLREALAAATASNKKPAVAPAPEKRSPATVSISPQRNNTSVRPSTPVRSEPAQPLQRTGSNASMNSQQRATPAPNVAPQLRPSTRSPMRAASSRTERTSSPLKPTASSLARKREKYVPPPPGADDDK